MAGVGQALGLGILELFDQGIDDPNAEEINAVTGYPVNYVRTNLHKGRMWIDDLPDGPLVCLVNRLYYLEPTEEQWGAGRQKPDDIADAMKCVWFLGTLGCAEGIVRANQTDDAILLATMIVSIMSGVGKVNKVQGRVYRALQAELMTPGGQNQIADKIVYLLKDFPPGIRKYIGRKLIL